MTATHSNNKISPSAQHVLICLLLLGAVLAGGCTPRSLLVREMTGLFEAGLAAAERDDDLYLLEEAFPSHIKLLEGLIFEQPDNKKLLTLAARMYGTFAFAFPETRLEGLRMESQKEKDESEALGKRVAEYYYKGAEYALRVLEIRHPGCRSRMEKVSTREAVFQAFTADDVPALFWCGFNMGGWVNQNRESIRAVARGDLAERAMKRVLQIEPEYYHSSARLFLMAYYGSRSSMLGGSPETVKAQYEMLIARQGDAFLMAHLFYGRFYLVSKQDRTGFKRLMKKINETSSGETGYAQLNAVAKKRAAIYLKGEGELFP